MLKVSEIFFSIQGESSFAGRPCVFVRLAGCNLDCRYCDTRYARSGGEEMERAEIIRRVKTYGCRLAEITGGEPLLQKETLILAEELIDRGLEVLVETNGSLPVKELDPRVIKILDIKTPGSGESDKIVWSNLNQLNPGDQIKFVLTSRQDYLWARAVIEEKLDLSRDREILLAPAFGKIDPAELARWILDDGLEVRLQLQLQKIVWPDREKGV